MARSYFLVRHAHYPARRTSSSPKDQDHLPLRLEYLRVRWLNKQSGLYLSLSWLYCVCSFVHHTRSDRFTQNYNAHLVLLLPQVNALTAYLRPPNQTWQRLTIISCDLTHECDTYFLKISHIIYPVVIYGA